MSTYGSLCSGIGGLDLAVERVFGYEPAWHSEVNVDALAVHDRHWPGVPNVGDLTVADWAEVEPVELICAGYPCQPFSHAGARRGEEDARHLWPHIAAAVRVLRPRWVVLENVAGHLSLGFGAVVGALAEAGYDAEWCCLRASDVGAPHRRERVFIVARDTERPRADAHTPSGRSRNTTSEPSDGVAADTSSAGTGWDGGAGPRAADRCRRAGVNLHAAVDAGSNAAPDADGRGFEIGVQLDGDSSPAAPDRRARGRHVDGRGAVAWGDYEPAIRGWERTLGRPAPGPVDGRGRLAPPFVEWMMGYPAGWVDGLMRTAALRCLGNAVVPQQGAAALTLALGDWEQPASLDPAVVYHHNGERRAITETQAL